jgi:hypothetical protein
MPVPSFDRVFPRMCNRGKHPSHIIPGLSLASSSHQNIPGGCSPVGNIPPPSGYPPRWSHHSKFINIFVLLYISIILLAGSKCVTAKMCEIKYKINTTPCRTSNAVDPAKRDIERTRIEPTVLDFRSRARRALPARRARLIGFPFWERAASRPPASAALLRLAIGGPAIARRLNPSR